MSGWVGGQKLYLEALTSCMLFAERTWERFEGERQHNVPRTMRLTLARMYPGTHHRAPAVVLAPRPHGQRYSSANRTPIGTARRWPASELARPDFAASRASARIALCSLRPRARDGLCNRAVQA
eukprot:16657-Rhodomonas_salina.3